MANKRRLKKQIRYICGDLAGECIFAREIIPGIDHDKANGIIIDIAALQSEALAKTTFAFDKSVRDFESRHAYRTARHSYFKNAYKTLLNEFNAGIDAVLKEMNGLLDKEQREANKQNVAK